MGVRSRTRSWAAARRGTGPRRTTAPTTTRPCRPTSSNGPLSDGSTNILPIGDRAHEAWRLHARLVRRALERGFSQGWDLHPAQLPTRFLATYAYYREGYPEVSARLRHVRDRTTGAVLDEPATVRALAGFVRRGVQSGAITPAEVAADTGLDATALAEWASPRRTTT